MNSFLQAQSMQLLKMVQCQNYTIQRKPQVWLKLNFYPLGNMRQPPTQNIQFRCGNTQVCPQISVNFILTTETIAEEY